MLENQGGLRKCQNFEGQRQFYDDIITSYDHHMITYDIEPIFLDFERIVTNRTLLRVPCTTGEGYREVVRFRA